MVALLPLTINMKQYCLLFPCALNDKDIVLSRTIVDESFNNKCIRHFQSAKLQDLRTKPSTSFLDSQPFAE